jgi:hypothetical protein
MNIVGANNFLKAASHGFRDGLKRFYEEKKAYRGLFKREICPLGRVIVDNSKKSKTPFLGYHGGPAKAWIDQVRNVKTIAEHNLFSGPKAVAAQYAIKYQDGIILELGSPVMTRNDLDSGIGMFPHLPAGAELHIIRAYELCPNFLKALEEQKDAPSPSLIECIKSAFMESMSQLRSKE